MEGKDWVLVNKSDASLYLELVHNKVGVSRGKGRACWQWTEDFNKAANFESHSDLAIKIKHHKIPIGLVKLKPYTNAFSEWMQRDANKPNSDVA